MQPSRPYEREVEPKETTVRIFFHRRLNTSCHSEVLPLSDHCHSSWTLGWSPVTETVKKFNRNFLSSVNDRCGVTLRSNDSSYSAADRIWKYDVGVVLVAWRAPPLAQCARSGRFLNTHTHRDARTRARTHIMDCNLRIPVTLAHTACRSRWPSLGPRSTVKGRLLSVRNVGESYILERKQ